MDKITIELTKTQLEILRELLTPINFTVLSDEKDIAEAYKIYNLIHDTIGDDEFYG